jgi:TonB family protein
MLAFLQLIKLICYQCVASKIKHEFSKFFYICIQIGERRKNMKGFLICLTLISLLLAACGKPKDIETEPKGSETELGGRRNVGSGSEDKLGGLMIGSDYKKPQGTVKTPEPEDIDINSDASRSKSEIIQFINARMPALRSIYSKYLKEQHSFSGGVVLKFTIAGSGEIIDISIASSTTNFPEFEEQIQKTVASWKWKAAEGSNTTVTILFNFKE